MKKTSPRLLKDQQLFGKSLVFVLLVTLPIVGFYFGKNYSVSLLSDKTEVKAEERAELIPLEISSDRQFMRIGEKYYEDIQESAVLSETIPVVEEWQSVTEISPELGETAEIFQFQSIPNTSSLLYTLLVRTDLSSSNPGGSVFKTYMFDGKNNKLLYEGLWGRSAHVLQVPRFHQLSSDGQYLSLALYGCWGCGGHSPELFIIDTKNELRYKHNLGKIDVDSFSWGENGSFSYQDGSKIINGSITDTQ